MATELPELLVPDAAGLRAWLKDNHATCGGVRLVLTRKGGIDTTLPAHPTCQPSTIAGPCDANGPTVRSDSDPR